ncbi:hypothetical protein [Mesorhizobium salmacidum]|uniref:SIR2-like domain-containing protein n=1 Tax=Mesorhizobium salmacidum TaxID=3015171 RepID=A0ABU8L7T9_9HYPH
MFERKTLFVVGAGASSELDMPMGGALANIIGDKLQPQGTDVRASLGDAHLTRAINLLANNSDERGARFFKAAQLISRAMPQTISIDNFLHAHADNEILIQTGKLAIAASILEAERTTKLYVGRDTDQVSFRAVPDTWHRTFCKMLCEGAQRTDLDHLFENVSIITFNYDRCIEHYLVQQLAVYFDLTWQRARDLTNKLTIIHPYGQVGKLDWQDSPMVSVDFGQQPPAQDLPAVAAQIRTFTERVDDADAMDTIYYLINEAKIIVYLGFSYGDMNMELMTTPGHAAPKQILGTSYGISVPNADVIKHAIADSMGENVLPEHALLVNCKSNQLLYDYWRPILKGRRGSGR